MPRALSREARVQMLTAASTLMMEGGVEAVTADEVARRSGVAKSTMYRHFESIDDLVIAALDRMVGEVAAPDSGSLREDLRSVIMAFRDVIERSQFRCMFASMLMRSLDDPEFARVFRRAQEVRHAPLRQAIQRGIARGEVDPAIDVDQAMYFVQGPFIGKRLIEDDQLTEHDIEVFLDLVVKALAPPN